MRTTDNKTILAAVKSCREKELEKSSSFTIDGKTSKYIDNNDKVIDVKWDMLFIKMKGGKNEITLPNYGEEGHIASIIEHAAEVLFFEYDLKM